MGAEAADVHLPQVEAGLALDDPLGHGLPDAPRAGQAMGAEPRRDEQPAHLGLAEAELAVGRERLRAVDQTRDLHVRHRRNPALRVGDDLREAVPVLLEQATVEVGRDRVEPAPPSQRPGRAVALVATHDQAAALLAEVDQQVRVAQRREGLLAALAEGLRDEVLVGHRHDRYAHARHATDLRRVHAAGVDDHLGLDVARGRCAPAHAAALESMPVTRVA